MNLRPAFTYMELMVVIVVTAILVVAAAPDGDTAANQQGLALIHRFEADVAYARSMSVAQPANPVVVNVDGANNRYLLARASTPNTPILHPQTGQPYVVQAGSGGGKGLEYVQIVALDFGGDQILSFDSNGSTDQNTPAVLQVKSGNSNYESSVDPTTGHSSSQTGYSINLSTNGTGQVFGGGYNVGTTFQLQGL